MVPEIDPVKNVTAVVEHVEAVLDTIEHGFKTQFALLTVTKLLNPLVDAPLSDR